MPLARRARPSRPRWSWRRWQRQRGRCQGWPSHAKNPSHQHTHASPPARAPGAGCKSPLTRNEWGERWRCGGTVPKSSLSSALPKTPLPRARCPTPTPLILLLCPKPGSQQAAGSRRAISHPQLSRQPSTGWTPEPRNGTESTELRNVQKEPGFGGQHGPTKPTAGRCWICGWDPLGILGLGWAVPGTPAPGGSAAGSTAWHGSALSAFLELMGCLFQPRRDYGISCRQGHLEGARGRRGGDGLSINPTGYGSFGAPGTEQ